MNCLSGLLWIYNVYVCLAYCQLTSFTIYLPSSRIAIYLLLVDTKSTAIQEQYDCVGEKNLDGKQNLCCHTIYGCLSFQFSLSLHVQTNCNVRNCLLFLPVKIVLRHPVVLLSFISWLALVRYQIDSNETRSRLDDRKKNCRVLILA